MANGMAVADAPPKGAPSSAVSGEEPLHGAAAAALPTAGPLTSGSPAAGMAVAPLSGFGNELSSEALPGALPRGQFTPRRVPYGLYAEQLSGTAFTVPRASNARTWLYRILPSAAGVGRFGLAPPERAPLACGVPRHVSPERYRWRPLSLPPPAPASSRATVASSDGDDGGGRGGGGGGGGNGRVQGGVDFLCGLVAVAGAGSPDVRSGLTIYMYACSADMVDCAASFADGELLLLPQAGTLRLVTEAGVLVVPPGTLAVVPRGMRFAVELGAGAGGGARGYAVEVFNGPFALPELGVIGTSGLAARRHFRYPTAAYTPPRPAGAPSPPPFTLYQKYGGTLWQAPYRAGHTPFDVVAWHGNHLPYTFDLADYCPVNAVLYDHLDPSIFTVLTVPSGTAPGVAVLDVVVFPPRWSVAEHTLRAPYLHRNGMSEFMGLLRGVYDAKAGRTDATDAEDDDDDASGFVPGAASLHPHHAPHGPDAVSYAASEAAPETPVRMGRAPARVAPAAVTAGADGEVHDKDGGGLAFMFESSMMLRLTDWAATGPCVDANYLDCWAGLVSRFDPSRP
ncbi:hypothetical protein MMPV_001923 [Pyropia vietnamensis]